MILPAPAPSPWMASARGTVVLAVSAFAASGFVVGRGYFAALRRAVALQVAGGAALRCLAWALGRIAAATVFFALAARWGALPLLAAFLGFLAARGLAVRAARSAA